MAEPLQLISSHYLDDYTAQLPVNWSVVIQQLRTKANLSVEDFTCYITASSLFSSKIEGNTLDFNSFNRNRQGVRKPKEVKEIEDLVAAYQFAAEHPLTLKNVLAAQALLSKTLVGPAAARGTYRKDQVAVYDSSTGRPVYTAVEPEHIGEEMTKLFADVEVLLAQDLSTPEIFYYASMLNLWMAMIHGFRDGNGRLSRLVEKWFLAARLGPSAWSITSGKYCWDHRPDYYRNIALGLNYYVLKWERCLSFLLMLPSAVL